MKKIFVLGSFVYDLVTTMDIFPEAKESVLGKKFETFPGGKGANQTIAIKRLGGNVVINGKVGNDDYGHKFLNLLKNEGISTDYVKTSDESTGIGCVQIDGNGQNRICIVLGANYDFNKSDLAVDELKKCDIFLTQFEMKREITEYGIKFAKENGLITFVNPAPAREIGDDIYKYIDYITPNEKEIEALTGIKVNSVEDAYKASQILLKKGVKNVICTIGEKGSTFVNNKIKIHAKAYKVNAIDTVAAGDSFNGAFVTMLALNKDIDYSLKFANAMGALTTLTKGAIPSLKKYDDVIRFMNDYDK
ncbi:MAG TPA: ribokinase [Firmicutes bacterium]|nr:ribokinase [Bacillota bacterium]